MSHITKIDLEISDIDALKACLSRISPALEFVANAKTFRWYGHFMGDSPIPEGMNAADYGKCDHKVRLTDNAGAYELGIVQIPGRKGYSLVYDNWCGGIGLEAIIGKGAAKVKPAYATEVATRQMRRQGYRVREETLDNGTVKLHCTKAGG